MMKLKNIWSSLAGPGAGLGLIVLLCLPAAALAQDEGISELSWAKVRAQFEKEMDQRIEDTRIRIERLWSTSEPRFRRECHPSADTEDGQWQKVGRSVAVGPRVAREGCGWR